MAEEFLKLCSRSLKIDKQRFRRDFAVFEQKKEYLKAKLVGERKGKLFCLSNIKTTATKVIVKATVGTIGPSKRRRLNEPKLNLALLEEEQKKALLKARKLRKDYDIFVFPESETTPLPIFSFDDLYKHYDISPRLSKNLQRWGMKAPLPVQMQVIPVMLKGHELQCCAPTGSGKTLAFLIPIVTILEVVY
ncbi:hypothetical protein RFI_35779, partial [Reticulomyxa filosa]